MLHEFKLGILKTTLKYLIRILYVISPLHADVFNERQVCSLLPTLPTNDSLLRFILVPPFGQAGICRFPANVAEMSLCPAWYFEDVLQVRPLYLYIQNSPQPLHNVPCQSSSHCFPPAMMKASKLSSSDSLSGTHWRSSASILKKHSCSFTRCCVGRVTSYASSRKIHVVSSTPQNFLKKLPEGRGGRSWGGSRYSQAAVALRKITNHFQLEHVQDPCFRGLQKDDQVIWDY
jgi:hypothetical protein